MEDEEEELFEVECFLNTRVKDGQRYYKVRWKGFSPEEDTWEPEENVLECEEALTSFWEKRRQRANKKQKKRRYRLMSEEEDTVSPSSQKKSARSLCTDIEPLGLTRQASKELAMCLNKSQTTQRLSDSSSHTGSDVTPVENYESSQTSSKSAILSSQTSDITSSEYAVLSQSSDLKSSQGGSDVLNQSTESVVNDSNSSTGARNVSSQESLSERDLDSSPQDTLNRNKPSKTREATNIEVISLLSDSEDTEYEVFGTYSPHVLSSPRGEVSRNSSPVTSPNLSQSNQTLDKVTDSTPSNAKDQSPTYTKQQLENVDLFASHTKRKSRFELSLKKNRKRSLVWKESSFSEFLTTKDEIQSMKDTIDTGISGELLDKERGETQLKQLRENMSVLENVTQENSEINCKAEKIKPEIVEKKSNENLSCDDTCPTLTELKGIMHKIANKEYEQKDIALDENVVDLKTQDYLDSSPISPQFVPEGPEDHKQQLNEEIHNSDELVLKPVESTCDDSFDNGKEGVNDDASAPDSGFPASNESVLVLDENEKNTMASLIQTEQIDETKNYRDSKKIRETGDKEEMRLNNLEKSADTKTNQSDKLQGNLTCDSIVEKEENAAASSSSNKVLMLTSETTSRVLKNLRSLAAKRRECKSVETTGKKTLPRNCNSEIVTNAENRNSVSLLNEETLQNQGNLNGMENKREKKSTAVGVEEANENEEIVRDKNNYNKELELLEAKIKTSYDRSDSEYNNHNAMEENTINPVKVGERTDIVSVEREKPLETTELISRAPCTTESPVDASGNFPSENSILEDDFIEEFGNTNKTSSILEDTEMINSCFTTESVASGNTPTKDAIIPIREEQYNNSSNDSKTGKNISNVKKSNSMPNEEQRFNFQSSFDDSSGSPGNHGDQVSDETLKHEQFQAEQCDIRSIEDEAEGKSGKSKKDFKKITEKSSTTKSFKEKKSVHTENGTNQYTENSTQRKNILSTLLESKSPKVLKQNKMNKQAKSSKTETFTSTRRQSGKICRTTSIEKSTSLENRKDAPVKKGVIINANFTSSLTSGDLIGLIMDEGNRENSLKENEKDKSVDENKSSGLPLSDEENVMVDDDEDNFDFELEEYPLEKLLQEEDEFSLRYIPSPPVQPLDVPFASVKTAIREGDEMTVRAALAGGLELDTLDGASGMTLLMIAAASGQDGVVELLLRRKAEVNACQKNGMTALMHSCEQGYPDTAHILLLSGADINKQQIAGETALMKACKKGHTDVVEVLLRNGADIKLESKSGHTAQQFCIRGYPELSTLIEEHERRLSRVVEEAILKCLGDTVSLCKPAILSYRCLVPREGQQMTLPFHFSPQNYNKDVDVILFCIKAVFDDVMSLLFGEENGIRGVLLNNKLQIPLLHGIRSIFSIDPKPRLNTITLQTHNCNNPASKVIACIYAVQSRG